MLALGCGDDDGAADGGADAGADGGVEDAGPDAGPPDAWPPPGPAWCEVCRRDTECGEGNLCLVLDRDERSCGRACESDADCSDLGAGVTCVEEVPGMPRQCRPTSGTCVTVAAGTECAGPADCGGPYDRCVDADGLGSVCTSRCAIDADCPRGFRFCRDVAGAGRVCIPDERPPPERCAARIALGQVTACGAGGTCADGRHCLGRDPGICVMSETLKGNCPPGETRVGADGGFWCVPDDCTCWADDPGALLDDALAELGRTRCDMHWPSALLDRFEDSAHDPFRLSWIDRLVGYWPNVVGFGETTAAELDAAAESAQPLQRALRIAAARADLVIGEVTPPAASSLGDALESLVSAAGGTPDRAAIDAQVSALDPELARRLAPVVAAVRDAHLAREAALA